MLKWLPASLTSVQPGVVVYTEGELKMMLIEIPDDWVNTYDEYD